VKELIHKGYLAPFKVFGAKLIQLKDVKIGNGDYHRQSLIDEIDRSIVYGDLLSAYRQYADNTKTVVFCVDIQHSLATAAAYQAAGIAAEHIDGDVSVLGQMLDPSNWTLDLEAAEKYVNFARLQRKMYQIVKLTRGDNSQWMLDRRITNQTFTDDLIVC
jgi:hypothetical protein